MPTLQHDTRSRERRAPAPRYATVNNQIAYVSAHLPYGGDISPYFSASVGIW
jgi:hypothetical protein